MDEIIQWLLEGEPWVEYRTRVDLLGQSENKPEVIRARKEMIEHPKIGSLLVELKNWPGKVLSSHRSASQPFHKLSFIADLGLKKCGSPIDELNRFVDVRASILRSGNMRPTISQTNFCTVCR